MRSLLLALFLVPAVASAQPKGLPAPGDYECRIDAGYKFKPCTIKALPNGGVTLEVTPSLFGISGQIVSDEEGRSLLFIGRLTDERPFGCFSCAPRCAEPGSCSCVENPPDAAEACRTQPIVFPLKKRGKSLSGEIKRFSVESNYQDGKRVGSFPQLEAFEFSLRPRR